MKYSILFTFFCFASLAMAQVGVQPNTPQWICHNGFHQVETFTYLPTYLPTDESLDQVHWLAFTAKEVGDVQFSIQPYNHEDDIDFYLFDLGEKADVSSITVALLPAPARAHIGGLDLGDKTSLRCLGKTGLSLFSNNDDVVSGCPNNSNNFGRALEAGAGHTFLLLVTNYNNSKGFEIDFDGTFAFQNQCEVAGMVLADITSSASTPYIVGDISPNPSTNLIQVSIQNAETPVQWVISNSKGSVVQRGQFSSETGMLSIPIEALPVGYYQLQLSNAAGLNHRTFVKM